MNTIIRNTMGLLAITIVLASCSKGNDNPNPEGTDECWYSITLDKEIAGPNQFGQDNIHLSSAFGTHGGEEEGGLSIFISQTKADGKQHTVFFFGLELEKFNPQTPVGTVFTADSAIDAFQAHSFITPEWGPGPHYLKVHGNGDERVPTLPTLTVLENSDQRIRFRIGGMVEKWEGDLDNDARQVGLVSIAGELIIGRSHYNETPIDGAYIANVNCGCAEQ